MGTELRQSVHRKPGKPRAATKRAPIGLSRNVQSALRDMVYDGLSRKEAAARNHLTDHSLYLALRNPQVLAEYNRLLASVRESERARNLHTLVSIRDEEGLKTSAAGQRVRVAAVEALEPKVPASGPNVHVSVNNAFAVQQPGYLLDLTGTPPERLDEIERAAMIGRRGRRPDQVLLDVTGGRSDE